MTERKSWPAGFHYKSFISDEEAINYLDASARLRRTSRTFLIKSLIDIILRDQLILSILDDEGKPAKIVKIRTGRPGRPKRKMIDGTSEERVRP